MTIALGADHAGFELKEKIRQHLANRGFDLDDRGTNSADSVDYPDFARLVGEQVSCGKADLAF
jgi:ribose 5-phosphate isomerase RpiB